MSAPERDPNYTFGAFEFDGDSHELTRAGEPVALRPQPAGVLGYLLANSGRLVSREELRDHIWGEEVNVDYEHSLNSCIRQVRAALGESADDPQCVQTFPRRGYKFIADVEVERFGNVAANDSEGGTRALIDSGARASAAARPGVWLLLTIVIAVAAALGTYAYWLPAANPTIGTAGDGGVQVLAVLPFRSLSDDPDDLYFGEGLSEELVGRLGRIDSDELVVLASNKALRDASQGGSALDAAARLGADLLLSGTVRRADDAVRVTSQLLQVSDGTQVWAGNYEGRLADIFGIQKTITAQIVGALSAELEVAEEVAGEGEMSPAYHAYLRALARYKRGTADDIRAALPLYEEALALDPALGEAWAGLALALVESDLSAAEKLVRAPIAVERALGLDATLANAYLARAELQMYYEWDLYAARTDFERATQFGPGMPMTHMGLAAVLSALGQHDRAVAEARRGLELDPLSVTARSDTASVLYFARQYHEAIVEARLAIDLEPHMTRAWHILLYAALGADDEVIAREVARHRLVDIAAEAPVLERFDAAEHAEAMALFWNEYVGWIEANVPPSMQAIAVPALVQLGQYDRALELLAQGVEDRSAFMVAYLGVVPFADPLRSDPRFEALLANVRRDPGETPAR